MDLTTQSWKAVGLERENRAAQLCLGHTSREEALPRPYTPLLQIRQQTARVRGPSQPALAEHTRLRETRLRPAPGPQVTVSLGRILMAAGTEPLAHAPELEQEWHGPEQGQEASPSTASHAQSL